MGNSLSVNYVKSLGVIRIIRRISVIKDGYRCKFNKICKITRQRTLYNIKNMIGIALAVNREKANRPIVQTDIAGYRSASNLKSEQIRIARCRLLGSERKVFI